MASQEAFRVQSALEFLRASLPGSTKDLRVDAIVETLEAISKWIEKIEREFELSGDD